MSPKPPVSAYRRYGRWQIESRLRDEVEFNWIEGSKLIVRNGMTGATGNIYRGLHEFADMAFVLHLLQPDDLFVDVTASGMSKRTGSKTASRWLRPHSGETAERPGSPSAGTR